MDIILQLGEGATANKESQSGSLAEDAQNLFLDGEGYLASYPGKTDIFRRGGDLAQNETPPTGLVILRVVVYYPPEMDKQIIFAAYDPGIARTILALKEGNSYKVLLTFGGYDVPKVGAAAYPVLFQHDGFLIILMENEAPRIWDGITAPHPLGVQEIPSPPDSIAVEPPGYYNTLDFDSEGWWTRYSPHSGPSSAEYTNAAGEQVEIPGVYMTRVQFVDRFGNKSKPSAPSARIRVKHYTEEGDYNTRKWIVSEWFPPRVDQHVCYIKLGRTVNLTDNDGFVSGAGIDAYNRFYNETTLPGITQHRFTHTINDTSLLLGGEMDLTVEPAPFGGIGASWGNRIFIAFGYTLWWSDVPLFGQFRLAQTHRALSKITAVVPLGDRIVVITDISTEILFENNGVIVPMTVIRRGSRHPNSIVDVGGALIGVWEHRWMMFDGNAFNPMYVPPGWSGLRIRPELAITKAALVGDYYMVCVSEDHASLRPNRVYMYHLRAGAWYRLTEAVNDIVSDGQRVLCCSDSIYEMFVGEHEVQAILSLADVVPPGEGTNASRSMAGLRILAEQSSTDNAYAYIASRRMMDSSGVNVPNAALMAEPPASHSDIQPPVWGAASFPQPYQDADFWIRFLTKSSTPGPRHYIRVEFPVGHHVRVRAMEITFSDSGRS